MAFAHPAFRIIEIVKAAKCLSDGEVFESENTGAGLTFDLEVVLLDDPNTTLRFKAATIDPSNPDLYHAALILDDVRIRGVDYMPTETRKRFKVKIPKGWHQNIINPHLTKNDLDSNRHAPLNDFAPQDFNDFVRKVAALWNIQLKTPDELA